MITGADDAVRNEIRAVLEMSKGVRGEQQRRQVQALGKAVLRSLKRGGSGDVDLGRFGEMLGLRNV